MSEPSVGGRDQLGWSGWGMLVLATMGLIAMSSLVLVLTGFGLRGLWGAASVDPAPAATSVRWTCDPSLPLGLTAACDDTSSLPDARAVSRAARMEFGRRYGGLWIDRSTQPARMVVGVVDRKQGDSAAARRVGGGSDRVVAAEVKYSLGELRATRAQVAEVVARATRWSLVRVDAQTNRVLVALLPADRPAVQAALQQGGVALSQVTFEEFELPVPA